MIPSYLIGNEMWKKKQQDIENTNYGWFVKFPFDLYTQQLSIIKCQAWYKHIIHF